MFVTFRAMQAEDKELFKRFIRSLPRRDNYYLLVDVQNDQAIERWTNDLPWARHVGEIRMSVSAARRDRGIGRALASEIFSIARARGLKKLWARMAVSQEAAQKVFKRLGFRTEALLSDFVKNENGLTEDLVIMSYDFGELWSF